MRRLVKAERALSALSSSAAAAAGEGEAEKEKLEGRHRRVLADLEVGGFVVCGC